MEYNNKYLNRTYIYKCRKCNNEYKEYPQDVIDTFNGYTFICTNCRRKDKELCYFEKINIIAKETPVCKICNCEKTSKREYVSLDEKNIVCNSCIVHNDIKLIYLKIKKKTEISYIDFLKKIKEERKNYYQIKLHCQSCYEIKSLQSLNKDIICGTCLEKKKKEKRRKWKIK